MVKKTRDARFLNAFMSVWAIHKSGEPSEVILSAYKKALSKYDIEKIERAFCYALNDLQWFPKPVELRKFIEHGPGDIEDIAFVEADKVVNAVKDHGYYKSIAFDDPVTMAVITQGWGGWIEICKMRDDEIKWFRKDFVKIYRAYFNQGIKQYGHLVGYIEHSNALRDYPNAPENKVVLIGDEVKALEVLEHKKPNLKLIETKG